MQTIALDNLNTVPFSLAPYFVLWAVSLFTIIIVGGGFLGLFLHRPLVSLGRTLWLGDPILLWMAFAVVHHLPLLTLWRSAFGPPWGFWILCGALGTLFLLRFIPTPLRRQDHHFILAIVVWGGLIMAGENYLDRLEADRVRLTDDAEALLKRPVEARPMLLRALMLRRVEPSVRSSTERAINALENRSMDSLQQGDTLAIHKAALQAFRLQTLPALLQRHEREGVRLRTYQWIQYVLLGAFLLIWGLGTPLVHQRR